MTPLFNNPVEKKLVLKKTGRLELVPDGKGSLFSSLMESNTYNWLTEQGVQYLHCISSEDLLCFPADPTFIGCAVSHKVDCAVVVSKKRDCEDSNFDLSPRAATLGTDLGWEDYRGDVGNYLFSME